MKVQPQLQVREKTQFPKHCLIFGKYLFVLHFYTLVLQLVNYDQKR